MMNYAGLRAEQKRLREQGIYRGIGFATFVEVTNPSAAFYGVGGAKISAQDGVTIKLDAQGAIVCQTGVTEQGQGAEAVIAQVAASAFGVPIERVRVITGDTDNTPYGGGTWASRAAGIGGEAAWQAGKALRANVLAVAGSILQAKPEALDIRNGVVVDRDSGTERLTLAELARIAYFRPDTLPPGFQAELMATRHYVPRAWPFAFTNGIQASYLEVDTDSGFVTLLKHWCVEDCGTIINPQLVDEQIRGGIVQGIGGALFEQCLYDERGQLLNGNMADYLVPMAAEMPDIEVGHVVTPTADSELGAKGAGEAGTAGAPGCIMNAINDALRPLGAAAAHRHAVHAGQDSPRAGQGVAAGSSQRNRTLSVRPRASGDPEPQYRRLALGSRLRGNERGWSIVSSAQRVSSLAQRFTPERQRPPASRLRDGPRSHRVASHVRPGPLSPDMGAQEGHTTMDIKVGRKAIEEASKKLSNWGRWGKDDQIGTLNHVTPEDIVKAASLIRTGKAFALGIPLDRDGPQTGLFGGRFNPDPPDAGDRHRRHRRPAGLEQDPLRRRHADAVRAGRHPLGRARPHLLRGQGLQRPRRQADRLARPQRARHRAFQEQDGRARRAARHRALPRRAVDEGRRKHLQRRTRQVRQGAERRDRPRRLRASSAPARWSAA